MPSPRPRVSRFWDPKRIRIFCSLILAALLIHIAWTYLNDTAAGSLLKRGDFPSFYSAGMIIRQGLNPQLYSPQVLTYVQNLYWPSLHGNYISFPYPPFVGLGLSLFAYLPPALAKSIFTLLMIAALFFVVKLTRKRASCLRANPLALIAFLLGFFPLSFGIFGSQFTALNMLLYAGLLAGILKKTNWGDFWAGVSLGLWFFKPQYAAILLFFLILARAWRVVMGTVTVLILYAALGTLVLGSGWFWIWFRAAAEAAKIDYVYNHFNMISLEGFFYSLNLLLGNSRVLGQIFYGLALLISIVMIGGLSLLFFKAGKIMGSVPRRERIVLLLELAAPVILLASPHALFYDLGILGVAVAPHLKLDSDRKITWLIGLTAVASFVTAFKGFLPIQPLILFAVAGLVFFYSKVREK